MSISTYFHALGLPKKIVALAFWDEMNGGGIQRHSKGDTSYVLSAVFSPDGQFIISTSKDGTFIWATPETIMEYLKTAPFPKLTAEEKKNWASRDLSWTSKDGS